jgi:ADP-ribosylation factor-binding protein GGA
LVDLPGPALISSTTEHSSARGPTPTRSPAPPQVYAQYKPDYSSFSTFGSPQPASQSNTPQPSLSQQQQVQQQATFTKQQAPAQDPFAALVSPVRQSTPQQTQQLSHSIFDFGNHQAPVAAPAPAADDDEWAFSSALPEGLPSSNTIVISETALSIALHATREPANPSVITLSLSFSSKTDQSISDLEFATAVTKVTLIPSSS